MCVFRWPTHKHPSILHRVPGIIGEEARYTQWLESLESHHPTLTFKPMGNIKSPINLTCMYLKCGMEAGRNPQKHSENMQIPYREAAARPGIKPRNPLAVMHHLHHRTSKQTSNKLFYFYLVLQTEPNYKPIINWISWCLLTFRKECGQWTIDWIWEYSHIWMQEAFEDTLTLTSLGSATVLEQRNTFTHGPEHLTQPGPSCCVVTIFK